MKKRLRLLAALLAFCVVAAAFPPVGLALEETGKVHTLTSNMDLYDYLASNEVNDGDVIRCSGSIMVAHKNVSDDPWIIDKSITIEGGILNICRSGILLGADVTFKNTELLFGKAMCNAIVANGKSDAKRS